MQNPYCVIPSMSVLNVPCAVWRSDRRKAKPAQSTDVVDLGSTFGISFHGSDSESSDEEFEVEKAEVDSEGDVHAHSHRLSSEKFDHNNVVCM